ncbi:MAG: hypothetical protein AAFZ07_09270 [Actinomycetota bacterium]
MPSETDSVAQQLLAAAGVSIGEVPPRRFGADWFREQPAWLAVSKVAHTLVEEPGREVIDALQIAEDALAAADPDDPVVALVEIGFVEAMICASSHGDGTAAARLLEVCPPRVWGVWHRRRERLEALSEERSAHLVAPSALDDDDEAVAMLARCTTYRAESGRYVVLAELISADRPSPWALRHPIGVGLIFGGVMLVLLILSLLLA